MRESRVIETPTAPQVSRQSPIGFLHRVSQVRIVPGALPERRSERLSPLRQLCHLRLGTHRIHTRSALTGACAAPIRVNVEPIWLMWGGLLVAGVGFTGLWP